jgi:WD40 repeat protein
MQIWKEDGDGDDWRCVQTLAEPGMGHTSTVWSASFDAKGDRLVSCSDDLTLMIWDTQNDSADAAGSDHRPWKHLYTISGYHDRTIFSVHWSSANNLIASGAADDCIRIFAEDTRDQLRGANPCKMVVKKEKAHSTDVNCVRWHPTDPRLLASAGDDGTVRLWELVGDIEKLRNGLA